MSKEPFSFLRTLLEDVRKETKKKVDEKDYFFLSEHYNTWIDIIQPVTRSLSEFEKNNSLLVFRFVELHTHILWLWACILYGRYHHVIRELRYVFDSMLQAYYLDKEHPEANILCKLEILKEIEREVYGSRLIDRSGVKHKEKLKALYSTLSKYVHSSYEELKPVIKQGKVDPRIIFVFDDELFKECVELTNRVMDALYFIIMSRFPLVGRVTKKKALTMESLKEFQCELSLKYLKKQH